VKFPRFGRFGQEPPRKTQGSEAIPPIFPTRPSREFFRPSRELKFPALPKAGIFRALCASWSLFRRDGQFFDALCGTPTSSERPLPKQRASKAYPEPGEGDAPEGAGGPTESTGGVFRGPFRTPKDEGGGLLKQAPISPAPPRPPRGSAPRLRAFCRRSRAMRRPISRSPDARHPERRAWSRNLAQAPRRR
jgi:hypothetical protein